MGADGLDDRIGDLEHEPHAILHRAAVLIRPAVGVRLQKLIGEIAVRGVDLHAVEPSSKDGVLSRGRVQPHVFPDFVYGQRARKRRRRVFIVFGFRWDRDWAGSDKRMAFFL